MERVCAYFTGYILLATEGRAALRSILAAMSGSVGVCTSTRRLSRVLGLQLLHILVLMKAASSLRTASLSWHENAPWGGHC